MRMDSSIGGVRYDPREIGLLDDPYPAYATLRRAGALCRGGPAQWIVPRYNDVAALLNDDSLGHEFPASYYRQALGSGPTAGFLRNILLYRDPPAHGRLRQAMRLAVGPAALTRVRDRMPALVDGLLDVALDRRRFDAVRDLAALLPLNVIGDLLGLPHGDLVEIRPRASDLGKAFATQVSRADQDAANAAVDWMREYVKDLLSEGTASSRNALLSNLAAISQNENGLSCEEVLDNIIFLFFAGFETTMHAISTGCELMIRHADQFACLRDAAAPLAGAVEEVLRYDPPIQGVARIVHEPLLVDGQKVRSGRVLILLLGSANRDETVFAEPDRFDVRRRPNQHLSFGGGSHHCLGIGLARMELSVVFMRLLARFATLEAAGPAIRLQSSGFRSFASVPIAVTAA